MNYGIISHRRNGAGASVATVLCETPPLGTSASAALHQVQATLDAVVAIKRTSYQRPSWLLPFGREG